MAKPPSFMRRVAPAVLIGTAAVALVGLFDPALGHEATPASAPQPGTSPGDPASPRDTSSPGDTSFQGDGASPGDTASPAATCDNAQEVVGDRVSTRYGPVRVAAQVAGGQLCTVYATEYPYGDRRSADISDQVIPYLDQAATQLGVDFDAVSGATYTSEGYRDSLQSIIDGL